MNYFIDAVKNYAVFSGRVTRKQFWMFMLFYMIFAFVVYLLDFAVRNSTLSFLYSLALIIPSFAITARRLHDTNHSGWWQLIYFIPIIGIIVLFIFLVTDSQPGNNQYGPNPKGF